ncbi:MAG TPA: TIGR03557 family F420-dependent LLM class oxidoreductase [Actinomycetota bacterium]|nr:TIGR03557 family F420-dependent LLM class oxidoreductase [Actinomycetota bacterium]
MLRIGYSLSSEEHGPNDLIRFAQQAEEAGFTFALISDHFHPWIEGQGQSPFVWAVIGGIARATEELQLGTGVTAPITRIHPAIVAQAAATAAVMMPGRFFLGVGTGENLNEHILGGEWPSHRQRLETLEEAVEIMRLLWSGGTQSFRGRHYTVDRARIYTLPEVPPPILVAARGERAVELAGRIGDGLIGVGPDADLIRRFEKAGGEGKPRYGQVHVCWAESEAEARRIGHDWWPNSALKGNLLVDLATPEEFERAAESITEDDVADSVTCGPEPERHLQTLREYAEAGYDHIYVHQVGPEQDGFFRFYGTEVLPRIREALES